MTRLRLLLVLACAPLLAQANPQAHSQASAQASAPIKPAPRWQQVGRASGSVLYLDAASIAGAAQERRAWSLTNHAKRQLTGDDKPYRSVTAQHRYDCDARTITLLAQAYYPDPMGQGEAVANFKYEQYDAVAVAPGSQYDGALKRVCRQRPAGRGAP